MTVVAADERDFGALGMPYPLATAVAEAINSATQVNLQYGVPASNFGIVPQPLDTDAEDLIDQRGRIQEALDYSAENHVPILFPAGDFGHDGTLYLRTGTSFTGVPGGQFLTQFRQMDPQWPDCFAPEDDVVGAINIVIQNILVNGGWNLCATASASNVWSYATSRTITGVTQANPGVVTAVANEYVNGQRVKITGVVGMTELNGNSYIVRNKTTDTFTLETLAGVAVNTSGYTAYVSGGTAASMQQKGIYLTSPDSGDDTHNLVYNVQFHRIAGTGLYAEGRGEMVFQNIWTFRTAMWGVVNDSFDNWANAITIAVSGRGGWLQSQGNSRLSDMKPWFIGMNKLASETYGVGFELSGANTRNVVGTNITTQDTWGPAFKSGGAGNFIQGGADNTGSLYQLFGFGNSTVVSQPVIELNGAKYDRYDLAVAARSALTTVCYLVQVSGSTTTGNLLTLSIDEAPATPIYNTTTPVVVASGNTSAKRRNFINSTAGLQFLGSVTSTQMGDAADGINSRPMKGNGTQRYNSTLNCWMTATGNTTTSPWVGVNPATAAPVTITPA